MRTWARCSVLIGLWAVSSVLPAAGQIQLFAEYQGKMRRVTRVDGDIAKVVVDDRLVPVAQKRFALLKVKRFAPYLVKVRNLEIGTSALLTIGMEKDLNNEIGIRGELESAYSFENVFIVVDLESENLGRSLLVREVGSLKPRVPQSLACQLGLTDKLGAFRYSFHVFAEGVEVLNSTLPAAVVSQALNEMVAEKIQGIDNAPPRPFISPPPRYPESLLKARVVGSVVVAFDVAPTGEVLDPVVTKATAPAFGDAVLEAIREWRLLPKVENGRPVGTKVTLPFSFAPPDLKTDAIPATAPSR
jgi:TonB family protein